MKKRKRGSGPFFCPFPGCSKSFSRSDHLGRHKANHSSEKYKCEWPACGREFSRLDVKKKHFGRHLRDVDETVSRISSPHGNEGNADFQGQTDESPSLLKHHSSPKQYVNIERPLDSAISPLKTSFFERDLQNRERTSSEHKINDKCMKGIPSSSSREASADISIPIDSETVVTGTKHSESTSIHCSTSMLSSAVEHDEEKLINTQEMSKNLKEAVFSDQMGPGISSEIELPATLQGIQWLLGDYSANTLAEGGPLNQPETGAFHAYYDGALGSSKMSTLEEIFSLSPNFPNSDSQTRFDDEILSNLANCIPSVQDHPDFVAQKLEWFLEVYWLVYHRQYPILHRPSFSSRDTPILLLLSMIMMGASLSKRTIATENIQLVDPDGLSNIIANPLRWLLFASEQAKPPCKSWVIQSLVILETYEITSSSRCLHERACIYNGAKIQLLRRSPILGGDPLKEVDSDTSRSKDLWSNWIESESMKRVALMSFYIDSVHAIVFGHPLNLFANQINLSLPCPDDIWEYNNVDREKASQSVAQTPLFCDALKILLQKEKLNVGPFSMQILLAGLINLLLQIEQNISQWSSFGWQSIQNNWRTSISSAIDFWKTQLPSRNCCSASSSSYSPYLIATVDPSIQPSLATDNTRCNCPVYHAAQISMRMAHYDYIVFAGAPRRMNVPILSKDYEAVRLRIGKWATSHMGRLCVINSIILLCEVLLSPENHMEAVSYLYEPDRDPFIYRPNTVVSAVLSLWAYAFHLFGPESSFRSAGSTIQISEGCFPAMEDAPTYLSRIRSELKCLSGRGFSELNQLDANEYSEALSLYAEDLPNVKNLKNMVGLLSSLKKGYDKCYWSVGREYAKLLGNCIQRSLGSEVLSCHDMYDVL